MTPLPVAILDRAQWTTNSSPDGNSDPRWWAPAPIKATRSDSPGYSLSNQFFQGSLYGCFRVHLRGDSVKYKNRSWAFVARRLLYHKLLDTLGARCGTEQTTETNASIRKNGQVGQQYFVKEEGKNSGILSTDESEDALSNSVLSDVSHSVCTLALSLSWFTVTPSVKGR
ncbi:hypothetical protein TEA_022638 [Camellia sinensis var. sinensis]|uniref:Uncharacterized protein n=1 Tax=Camellia sinensis var. sinensis TaxID=542762 RepID=A0A4S4DQE5_CAMSN|nr:hypothetical protein TEA_022638 [Camellia sinensis var. sinensis]